MLFSRRTEIGLCVIALPSASSSIQILNQAADFHKAWWERCAIGGLCNFALFLIFWNPLVRAQTGEVGGATRFGG